MESSDSVIKQLDLQTAQRISSGQVITSMQVAVKELIENSLDAQATCLTIRFVDYGKELIEIFDNGTGIEERNFSLLGKRNCTSKLQSFEQLDSVETFGFRGEALSSLCNISKISIHTRHNRQTIGTILLFNTDCSIVERKLLAREIGTTVSLSQLFQPLPVRRKDLLSNARRAFDKTLSLIYQYCVGLAGIKISCFHKPCKSGQFAQLFASTGFSIQSNIIEIFNYKQFSYLMPFVCDKSLEDDQIEVIDVEIGGFISKPDTGCGRSSADRQYFYLNGRPCDMNSVNKRINQIYRSYNRNQYPFILLRIDLDEKLIDRNLSPDKRKILLADNHYIFKVIQHSLEQMFVRECAQVESMSYSQNQSNISSFLKRASLDDSREDYSGFESDLQTKIFKRCSSPCDSSFTDEAGDALGGSAANDADLNIFSGVPTKKPRHSNNNNNNVNVETLTAVPVAPSSNLKHNSTPLHPFFASLQKTSNYATLGVRKSPPEKNEVENSNFSKIQPNDQTLERPASSSRTLIEISNDSKQNNRLEEIESGSESQECDDIEMVSLIRKRTTVDWSMEQICHGYLTLIRNQVKPNVDCDVEFRARITPEDNETALDELKHTLSRQCLAKMKPIGQFNLGFIIAKLGKNLFIIDQHATDERHNFERLLLEPSINYQTLVCPVNLRLSALNEMIAIDHIDTFAKLGFTLDLACDAAPGHRIRLSRIPLGKEWVGGRADIEEIIAAIRDSPTGDILSQNFILSGLKREIAYRACRSAVMIGESLRALQMEQIVSRMADRRDPWHCAHNRPTIRHLICLDHMDSN